MQVTELVTHDIVDDAIGRWTMYLRPRHPGLREFVASHSGYTQRVLSPGRHATAATHMFPLVVSLEGRHSISPSGADATVVDSFVAGIYPRPVWVEATAFRGIQVDLTPLGAYGLLGSGAGELAERTSSLDAALNKRGRELVERIGNASSWAERLAEVERILLAWFDEAPRPSREVTLAWYSIVSGRGRRPIQDVARATGWSRSHLGRRMREQLGVSPKQLSRLVRFRHALDMIRAAQHPLAEIAVAAGYYDQAHMNVDFREFTARSPGSFLPSR